MRPASYDFRLPRGGTPFLGVVLHGRDPRTMQIARLPIPGVTVEWAIDWPSGEVVKTQFGSDAPLTIDSRTGAVLYPISLAHAEDLAAATAPIPTRINIIMSDGFTYPFLTGSIIVEG